MLAAQAGILGRNASAIGAVATSTGSNLPFCNTPTINTLTQRNEFLILGKTGLGLLGRQPSRNIFHVIVAEVGSKLLHHNIGALA